MVKYRLLQFIKMETEYNRDQNLHLSPPEFLNKIRLLYNHLFLIKVREHFKSFVQNPKKERVTF